MSLSQPPQEYSRCWIISTMLQNCQNVFTWVIVLQQVANNYQASVQIFKQFHKNIIGKGGANIKKVLNI